MKSLPNRIRNLLSVVTTALLVIAIASPSQAAELNRAEKFSLLHGSGEYNVETMFGSLRVYYKNDKTQISGEFQGIGFSSEDSSAAMYFSESEVREDEGHKQLTFKGPDSFDVVLVHDFGADAMPAEQREYLESLMPGMFTQVDGHWIIKTAVLSVTPAGVNVIAGFGETVPLQG